MKWCSVSQIWSKPSSSVHSICSSSRCTTSSWVNPGAAWKKKKVPKRTVRRMGPPGARHRNTRGRAVDTGGAGWLECNARPMKPPKFDYHAPKSVDEALAPLELYGGYAKLLAGGQSLMPLLN